MLNIFVSVLSEGGYAMKSQEMIEIDWYTLAIKLHIWYCFSNDMDVSHCVLTFVFMINY